MTLGKSLAWVDRAFDTLESRWERMSTQRAVATFLVTVFLAGLAVVEANRQGWLPESLSAHVSTSHFQALHIAFTLLLLVEVVGLVFGLAQSVANAAGKQFEILSLILIRQAFKELSHLHEPVTWEEASSVVLYIISDAVGALLIFLALVLYYRLQHHQALSSDTAEQAEFAATKKLIALLLLFSLILIAGHVTWAFLSSGTICSFFEVFYTVLVFADVLIVLISLRYSTAFPVVFRYFGFAVATVLVRLALTAPRIIDAALGLGATLFAVGLTWAYNRFQPLAE